MNLNRFTNIDKLIVHPGSAHRDDFLSVALILGSVPGSCIIVERRDPTDNDLEDLDTLVVDQGREYNPEKNNFDHHQFPIEADPACSITLILKALECYEDALEIWNWLRPSEIQDVRGPNFLAKELNIPGGGDTLLAVQGSPVEGYLLNMFQKATRIQPGDFLFQFLEELGISMLSGIKNILERLEDLKINASVFQVNSHTIIDNSYIPKDKHPGRGMNLFRKKYHPDAQITISSDKRGEGVCMTRTNDDGIIDFRNIKEEQGVRFVHASGFMCAIHKGIELKPLIEKSIC